MVIETRLERTRKAYEKAYRLYEDARSRGDWIDISLLKERLIRAAREYDTERRRQETLSQLHG